MRGGRDVRCWRQSLHCPRLRFRRLRFRLEEKREASWLSHAPQPPMNWMSLCGGYVSLCFMCQ